MIDKPVPASPAQISDEQAVKAVHPNAESFNDGPRLCGVYADCKDETPISQGVTEAEAWKSARSRLEPVEAPKVDDPRCKHCNYPESGHIDDSGYRWCTWKTTDRNVFEPVEVVSTTPPHQAGCICVKCEDFWKKEDAKVSTPLPQQEQEYAFEVRAVFDHPDYIKQVSLELAEVQYVTAVISAALPQQEEPANEVKDYCLTCKAWPAEHSPEQWDYCQSLLSDEPREDNFTKAARFAGITASQGMQFHLFLRYLLGQGPAPGFLPAAPIAPLLGQEVETDRESDGRYIAEVPSVPGAMAYGATEKEAVDKAMAVALLGQDEPDLPSLPKKVRGEDWAKYWGRAFDERTKSLTQALTSLAAARKEKDVAEKYLVTMKEKYLRIIESEQASGARRDARIRELKEDRSIARERAELAEASLAEAQKRIPGSELEKLKGVSR